MESFIPASTSGLSYWEDISPGLHEEKGCPQSTVPTGGGCVSQLGPLWSTQMPHISLWLQDLISVPVLVVYLTAHGQFLEPPVIVWMKSCRKTLQGVKLCCLGPESRLRVTANMLYPVFPGHPSFQRHSELGAASNTLKYFVELSLSLLETLIIMKCRQYKFWPPLFFHVVFYPSQGW